MKRQNILVVFSLLLNIILAIVCISERSFAASGIIMPQLPKGSGYELTIPNNQVTCNDVEDSMGLIRGSVVSITHDPVKGIIILFNKDVTITATQAQIASDTVKGLIPMVKTK